MRDRIAEEDRADGQIGPALETYGNPERPPNASDFRRLHNSPRGARFKRIPLNHFSRAQACSAPRPPASGETEPEATVANGAQRRLDAARDLLPLARAKSAARN